MIISFEKPLFFILIPLAVIFIMACAKNKSMGGIFKKRVFIAVRIFTVFVLIFCLATPVIKKFSNITTTVFAVDTSKSLSTKETEIKEFINTAMETMGKNDRTSIVTFGGTAAAEWTGNEKYKISEFNGAVDKNYTNIANAFKTSKTIIPEETSKRIVLISDGRETVDDAVSQAKNLKASNITVDTYFIEENSKNDVQISELDIPKYINKNVDYNITVNIESTFDTSAQIRLYKNKELVLNNDINLFKGQNKFIFKDNSDMGGGVIYRAEIQSKDDTVSENNTAYGYCYVEDIPRVLLVEYQENGTEIEKILNSSMVNVEKVSSDKVPSTLDKLNTYDGIVILDTPIDTFPKGFIDSLESYVKYTGGGLIATGGENSFALGGYLSTKLEEILPVDMELKDNSENPSLAMLVLIDRSGSMTSGNYGVSKMEMAKEAAIRGAETLKEDDYIGVLEFDDTFTWTVDIQQIGGNLNSITDKMGKIQPMGGTSILPALKEGYDKLKDINAKLKHIILLTDGQAEQSGYEAVLESIVNNGITLSSVAIGSDSDTSLLKKLAEKGGGRYYFTNEFTDLPEIFVKETFLAGKDYLNNREFYPKAGDSSAILNNIESIGVMGGYIATTPKQRADVVLKSDEDDPILAVWQYGLGRTCAWLGGMSGSWSKTWLSAEENIDIFRNSLSYVMRKQTAKDVSIKGEISGNKTILTLQMPYQPDINEIKANIISEGNEQYTAVFISDTPGIYKGEFDSSNEGAYIASIQTNKNDGTSEVFNTGFNLPYPKEYDIRTYGKGKAVLEKISQITGGTIIKDAQQVYTGETKDVYGKKDITSFFIVLMVIMLLIDIALRRFGFLTDRLERVFVKRRNKPKQETVPKVQKSNDIIKEVTASTPKTEPKEEKKNTASILLNNKNKRK